MLRLSAGWIWPGTGSPIRDAALLVAADGRIAAVGPEAAVPLPAGAVVRRFDGCVALPGFVNLHTHLELQGAESLATAQDFFAWLQQIRRARAGMTHDAFTVAARAALEESWSWGTTAVADTGTTGATVEVLTRAGGRGVYYHEVIAPDPADADRVLAECAAAVERLREAAGPGIRVGVSPHAPYTVSPALLRRTVEYARAESLPLAAHVAESSAESELVRHGTGAFAENWRARGIPLPQPARSPVAYVMSHGLSGEDVLAIHLVQTDRADIARIVEADVAVAACPRSNRRHGHGDPPLDLLLDAGVRMGLGTDSRASVESLDMRAEARRARALASLDADAALRLITVDGARALGDADFYGVLAAGAWADVCVVRPEEAPTGPDDVAERVLGAGAEAVRATLVAGKLVFERDELRSRA